MNTYNCRQLSVTLQRRTLALMERASLTHLLFNFSKQMTISLQITYRRKQLFDFRCKDWPSYRKKQDWGMTFPVEERCACKLPDGSNSMVKHYYNVIFLKFLSNHFIGAKNCHQAKSQLLNHLFSHLARSRKNKHTLALFPKKHNPCAHLTISLHYSLLSPVWIIWIALKPPSLELFIYTQWRKKRGKTNRSDKAFPQNLSNFTLSTLNMPFSWWNTKNKNAHDIGK